jgi:prophage regulatory protein
MCNRGDCICNVFPQPGLLNRGHANKRHRAFRSDRHVAAPVLPPNERRILRLDEVEAKSGFKRAHIYNLMKKRQFPQALRLGVRAVGWDSIEIDQWIAERLNHRT